MLEKGEWSDLGYVPALSFPGKKNHRYTLAMRIGKI